MLTLNEFPKSILAGVKATFEEGRNKYTPNASAFVQTVPSTLPIEEYVLFGNHRGPQQFTGEVRFSKIREYSETIANIEYYDALEIDYRLLKYDQTGKINMKASNFGYEWARGKDKQLITQISTGASLICYDGTPFFGASHLDMDSGVQANIVTGGSNFDATTYRVMKANVSQFKDDRGEVSGKRMTHVLVREGSVDELNARQLANSTYFPSANGAFTTNPFYGEFEVISSPYVPSAVKFIGLDLSGMNKPIVLQDAGPEIWTASERDSEWFQTHKQYRYAVHGEWGIGFNDWRLAYLQL